MMFTLTKNKFYARTFTDDGIQKKNQNITHTHHITLTFHISDVKKRGEKK